MTTKELASPQPMSPQPVSHQPASHQPVSHQPMTLKQAMSRFDCPSCGARYTLLRVEAEGVDASGQIACRSCGGPLQGYDGHFILKYFLLERPPHGARRQRSA
jgi:predicted RNA-binding Zn-ribbon protein involved in translation (DUF1610 family)